VGGGGEPLETGESKRRERQDLGEPRPKRKKKKQRKQEQKSPVVEEE